MVFYLKVNFENEKSDVFAVTFAIRDPKGSTPNEWK